MQIDLVRSEEDLARLEADWNGLFERAGRAHQVFQTFAFVELWNRVCCPGLPETDLAIATARRGGRLVMVWPLVVSRQHGLKVLSWLGEPIAQYGDVLIDPDEEPASTLGQAFDMLRASLTPDVVRLRKTRRDAAIAPFLAQLGITATSVEEAPCVTLAAGGAAFELRQSGKARKNRRRLMRRLEERGRVEHVEASGTPTAVALAAAGLAAKRDWLRQNGLVAPAFADGALDRFILAAAGEAAAGTGCRLWALRLEGRPVAVALGFVCQRRLMLHLVTHTADVAQCGAGVLNLEAILRRAEADGLEAVDLLPPRADYKLDWADSCVAVGDYAWGLSARGKACVALVDVVARPTAKRAIAALPLTLRRRIADRALGPRETAQS